MNDTFEPESYVKVKRAYDKAPICKKAGIVSVILGVVILINIVVLGINNILPKPIESLSNVLVPILWLGGAFAVWYSGKFKIDAMKLYAETILKPIILEKYPQATYIAYEMDAKNESMLGKFLAKHGMPIDANGCAIRKTNLFKANDQSKLEYGSTYYSSSYGESGVGTNTHIAHFAETRLSFNVNSVIRKKDVFEISSGIAKKIENFEVDDKNYDIDCFSDKSKEILKRIQDEFGSGKIIVRDGKAEMIIKKVDVFTSCPDSLKDISAQELNKMARDQVERFVKFINDLTTVITETDFAKYKHDL